MKASMGASTTSTEAAIVHMPVLSRFRPGSAAGLCVFDIFVLARNRVSHILSLQLVSLLLLL